MSKLSMMAAALIATTVAGCDEGAPPTSEARPVRTVTVEHEAEGETVSLTGHIRAKDRVSLAFRLYVRMMEPWHVRRRLAELERTWALDLYQGGCKRLALRGA
jgi:hypothetical protein